MIRRFYVPPPALDDDRVELVSPLTQRLATVLRLRAGDEVALFDGAGNEALVTIESISPRGGVARILERREPPREPRVAVHLYQSITKQDRFEWLIEKATEIGVARIVPMIAARAVVVTPRESARAGRWQRIAIEAAEQCGRGAIPPVDAPVPFDEALASAPGLLLVPYESAGEAGLTVASALAHGPQPEALSIFIGPEGGYEPAEVERARAAGAIVVTLGRRVLRSETAGLVAATLALQALGELG